MLRILTLEYYIKLICNFCVCHYFSNSLELLYNIDILFWSTPGFFHFCIDLLLWIHNNSIKEQRDAVCFKILTKIPNVTWRSKTQKLLQGKTTASLIFSEEEKRGNRSGEKERDGESWQEGTEGKLWSGWILWEKNLFSEQTYICKGSVFILDTKLKDIH